MKPTRTVSRRSFLRQVAGTTFLTGGALAVCTGEARAAVQVSDGDREDPGGRGRSAPGLSDNDSGRNADREGFGRGNRQRGLNDSDQGPRGDPSNQGRGTTDADPNDQPGRGRGTARGRGPAEGISDRDPTDPQGQGRGGRPTPPPTPQGVTDSDPSDPAGQGRGSGGGGGAPPRAGSATGTGFFVSADGQILTSHHVVENARSIFVTDSRGTRRAARVVRSNPQNDLSVLQVAGAGPGFLTLASSREVRLGARVFTIGFPSPSLLGRDPKYTEGTVSSLSGLGDSPTFLQISVPIQPGNSGGPLISEGGQVIGVIAATAAIEAFFRATGSFPQNVNWAVKSEYALPMIRGGRATTYPSREAAIDAARAAVVFIEALG